MSFVCSIENPAKSYEAIYIDFFKKRARRIEIGNFNNARQAHKNDFVLAKRGSVCLVRIGPLLAFVEVRVCADINRKSYTTLPQEEILYFFKNLSGFAP